MSKKGVSRGATTKILVAALLWTVTMAASIKGRQAQTTTPGSSDTRQKQVLGMEEACQLLNTARLKRNEIGWMSKKTIIGDIQLSMDDICAKEESFKNKVMPATDIVENNVVEVLYSQLKIKDTKNSNSNEVITSRHIEAFNRFLLMFAGRRIEMLLMENKMVTQNKEELLKIKNTLKANSWVGLPISVGYLECHSIDETKGTHPILLQIMIRSIGDTEIIPEKKVLIWISIAANHIQQAIRLLGNLKYKKIGHLDITIKDREVPLSKATAIGSNSTQTAQEWKYEVDALGLILQNANINFNLPDWLLKKPKNKLLLNVLLYMHLSNQEIQKIKVPVLTLFVSGGITQYRIDNNELLNKKKGIINTKIKGLHIWNDRKSIKNPHTIEETKEYLRLTLDVAKMQFSSLDKIYIEGLSPTESKKDSKLSQAVVFNMVRELAPRMPMLRKIRIEEYISSVQ